jgi:hypothetical protein
LEAVEMGPIAADIDATWMEIRVSEKGGDFFFFFLKIFSDPLQIYKEGLRWWLGCLAAKELLVYHDRNFDHPID